MLALSLCIQLLELNVVHRGNLVAGSESKIFEWVIQKCFTAPQEIADLCFIALGKVYALCDRKVAKGARSGFPDDSYMNSVLALTLLNIGSMRVNVHETSIGLLRILNRRYLIKPVSVCLDLRFIKKLNLSS